MTNLEKICKCFWKTSYDDMKGKDKLSETFDICKTCEGYKTTCKNYFYADYSPLNRRTKDIEQ